MAKNLLVVFILLLIITVINFQSSIAFSQNRESAYKYALTQSLAKLLIKPDDVFIPSFQFNKNQEIRNPQSAIRNPQSAIRNPNYYSHLWKQSLYTNPIDFPQSATDLAFTFKDKQSLAELFKNSVILLDTSYIELMNNLSFIKNNKTKDINFTDSKELNNLLNRYVDKMILAKSIMDSAISKLNKSELDSLIEFGIKETTSENDDSDSNIGSGDDLFKLDESAKKGYKYRRRIMKLYRKIDFSRLFLSSYIAVNAVDELESELNKIDWSKLKERKSPNDNLLEGNILVFKESPIGLIIIGGKDKNIYKSINGNIALLIDVGGEDSYAFASARLNLAENRSGNVIIDMGQSNDSYQSKDIFSYGAGFFSTGIFIDYGGNNNFDVNDFSLGAGYCGTGIAIMRGKGDNHYHTRDFSLSASMFGVGIFVGSSGDDKYISDGIYNNCYAGIYGSSLFLENGGDDYTIAISPQVDLLRYNEHRYSLSIACSFGDRLVGYPGGPAVYIDYSGNDTRIADIFGIGVGYFGTAMLLDGDGSDTYKVWQYGIGAGIHTASGLIIDNSLSEGQKNTFLGDVCANGYGHDSSIGWLILSGEKGKNLFQCSWLGLGTGHNSGWGFLLELSNSENTFAVPSQLNTVVGWGDYDDINKTSAVGVLYLSSENNWVSKSKADSTFSRRLKLFGQIYVSSLSSLIDSTIEYEFSFGKKPLITEESRIKLPNDTTKFTLSQLAVMASEGEKRFQEWQKFGERKIIETLPKSYPYLLEVWPGSDDVREPWSLIQITKKALRENRVYKVDSQQFAVDSWQSLLISSLLRGDSEDSLSAKKIVEILLINRLNYVYGDTIDVRAENNSSAARADIDEIRNKRANSIRLLLNVLGDVPNIDFPNFKDLESLGKDSDPRIRSSFYRAIGRFDNEQSSNILKSAFYNEDNIIAKKDIVYSLGNLKDTSSVHILISALSETKIVRFASASALINIGIPVVNTLLHRFEESNDSIEKSLIVYIIASIQFDSKTDFTLFNKVIEKLNYWLTIENDDIVKSYIESAIKNMRL